MSMKACLITQFNYDKCGLSTSFDLVLQANGSGDMDLATQSNIRDAICMVQPDHGQLDV